MKFYAGIVVCALIWFAAVFSFLTSVVRSPDPVLMSRADRSVLIGLKGGQSQQSSRFDAFDADIGGGGIVLGSVSKRTMESASATWRLNTRNIFPLLENAHSGTSKLAIYQFIEPRASKADAYLEVYVNGRFRKRLDLSSVQGQGRDRVYGLPSITSIEQSIPFASNYAPKCLVIDLTQNDLSAGSLVVRLETHHYALWWIHSVYTYTSYRPNDSPLFGNVLVKAIGALAVLVALGWAVSRGIYFSYRIAGPIGVAAALGTLALAAFSKDPWDLGVWSQLLDIAAFGGGSPVFAWTGTALWSFLPGLLSPVLVVWNDVFGSVPELVNIVLLKIALWCAFVGVVCELSAIAKVELRRVVYFTWLLSPFSLYMVSWGVRDLVSALLALISIRCCIRNQLLLCAIFAALAISVDEYFAPLTLLPGLVILLGSRRTFVIALKGALLSALPIVLVLAQWVIAGGAYSKSVLTYRLGVTFMDFTWQYLLDKIGLLPSFVATHQQLVFVVLFCGLCMPFAIRMLREVFAGTQWSFEDATFIAMRPIVGCVAAFFLSYGQADHQEWFGLLALVQVVAAREVGLQPIVPIFLMIAGLEVYAHVGLREFLDPAFFNLQYLGIWGTHDVVDRALNGTCLALISVIGIVLLRRGPIKIASAMSSGILVVWFLSLLSCSSGVIGNDLVLLGSAVIVMSVLSASTVPEFDYRADVFATLIAFVSAARFGPWALGAAMVAFGAGMALNPLWRERFRTLAPLDLVLVASAIALQVLPIARLNPFVLGVLPALSWLTITGLLTYLLIQVPRAGAGWLSHLAILQVEPASSSDCETYALVDVAAEGCP